MVGEPVNGGLALSRSRVDNSERWRDILDAAAKLFAERGYAGTSLHHIADHVGITKGSLFHYIDTKDDLLFEVLLEIHEIHLQHFDEYAEASGGPLERLRAFIEGHARVNIADIDRGSVFYLNFDSLSAERRDVILRTRRKFDEFLRRLLHEAKVDGLIRPDVDEQLAAIGILTALNSMHLWWKPDYTTKTDVPTQFADLFICGVTGAPHRDPQLTGSPE